MHIIRRHGWEVTERQVTPEHVVLNRRSLLAGATCDDDPAGHGPSGTARADVPVNPAFKARPAVDRGKIRHHLQQLL